MPNYDENSPDQLTKARGICMQKDHHVKKILITLKSCEDRIASKSYTAETCHQETMDLMEALDHCVGDSAFLRIK
ncbi:unnamed protein product [Colias eurytheme]|nr:unnamed protein product [Colias eurytheme]